MDKDQCVKTSGWGKAFLRILGQASAVFFLLTFALPARVYPDAINEHIKSGSPSLGVACWTNGLHAASVTGDNGVMPVKKPSKFPQEKAAGESKPAGIKKPAAPQKNNAALNTLSKDVFHINSQAGKKVALTFDDGPYPELTSLYLKVLDDCKAKATFFVVAKRVEWYPDVTKKIISFGQELGSHSYAHSRLVQKTGEELESDFQKSHDIIKMVTGQELGLFRPPYGGYNDIVVVTAKKHGLSVVNWSVDPRDWESKDSAQITERVLSKVKDGSVVVMHEGRQGTLAALPKIIEGLRAKGFELVTVSQLMQAVPANI